MCVKSVASTLTDGFIVLTKHFCCCSTNWIGDTSVNDSLIEALPQTSRQTVFLCVQHQTRRTKRKQERASCDPKGSGWRTDVLFESTKTPLKKQHCCRQS